MDLAAGGLAGRHGENRFKDPASCAVCVPSTMVPQLMSISSDMRLYREVFDAILREGVGLQPKTDPLPVVKQMTLAPLATCPVAETGSKPGESIKTRPFCRMGSA